MRKYLRNHFELSEEQLAALRATHPERVSENPEALVALEVLSQDKADLHWAADDLDALVRATDLLRTTANACRGVVWEAMFINEPRFAGALLETGFRLHGHYLDHWLDDLDERSWPPTSDADLGYAKTGDSRRLAQIATACVSPGWLGDSAAWFEEWLSAPASSILVLQTGVHLSGFCCVRQYGEHSDKVWIRALAVDPEHQRSGLGRSLLVGGLAWGRERGASRAFLAVDSRNEHARRLYQSVGFWANGEQEFRLTLPGGA